MDQASSPEYDRDLSAEDRDRLFKERYARALADMRYGLGPLSVEPVLSPEVRGARVSANVAGANPYVVIDPSTGRPVVVEQGVTYQSGSPESGYQVRYSKNMKNDQQMISGAYRRQLDRDSELMAQGSYVPMPGKDAYQAMLQYRRRFAEGGEARTPDAQRQVEELYRQNLGREADTGGLEYWKKEFGPEVDVAERLRFIEAAQPEVQRRMAANDTTLPEYMKVAPNVRRALQSQDITTDEYKTLANYFGNQWIAGEAEDPASLTRRDYIERPRTGYDLATFLASRSQQHGAQADTQSRLSNLLAPYTNTALTAPVEMVYTGGESNDFGYRVTNPITGQQEIAYRSGPLGPTGENIYRTSYGVHHSSIGDPDRTRYAVGLDYTVDPATGQATLTSPYLEGYQERRRNNAFPIAALATMGGMAMFPGFSLQNMASRGLLSLGAQGVSRMAQGGEVTKFVKRQAGSPEEGEVAEQMTVGTRLTDQEMQQPSVSREAFEKFKATAPAVLGMIPQAANTVAGNILQGITDPKAHAKRSLENIAKQLRENPEEFVMNWTGGGLGGVLKPKGGIFPKAGTGSGIDTFLQRVEEQVGREAQDLTVGQVKTLNEFIKDKGRKYLTTTYGSGSDPLRDALLEGRLPAFGTDAKNFRDYMLQAAREGNPRALEDFETMYDTKSGIGKFVAVPSRDQYDLAAKIRDKATQDMLDKIAKEGVDPERITEPFLQRIDMESMLKNYSPEYQKNLARRLLGEEFPEAAKDPNSRMYLQPEEMADETLIRAAREGEVFYDIPASPSLDFLDPKNLAKSLATLNPDKLSNMSFAEAVVQGTKNTKLQRDWDEVIKKVEGNKSVPKEMFDFGTETFRPMGQDKWVRLLTPQAVQLEGAAMHHSVGGYAKKGSYGEGGREALESGLAQVFSLRGPDNMPRVTIEARKNDNGTLFVKQIKGNFNGVPDPADQEIIVQFLKDLPIDKIQPERYIKTRTGQELEEAIRIDWSERAGFGARSIF